MKGNWRLPTKEELLDVYYSDTKELGNYVYWSGSSLEYNRDTAWYVSFSSGRVKWCDKSYKGHICLVRDTEEGLEWSSTIKHMTWYEAMEYAEEMNG